jgi:hypothetical protein
MALNSANPIDRGATILPHLETGFPLTAASAITSTHRLLAIDTASKVATATAGSKVVVGLSGNKTWAAGDRVDVKLSGAVTADDALVSGQRFKAGDSGRALALVDSALSGTTIKASGNGLAFTNQPANDGLEVVSSNVADTTQTLTVVGTTTGVDTVVVETVTLNGTTQVDFVKVDWGLILAAWLSASAAGTVTLREASANATVVAFTTGQLTKGVETVTAADQQAYNVAPTMVGSGATTKQVGLKGTNSAGTTIYDSKALNGTTAVTANSAFKRITEVYTGDLESNRTVTVKVGAAESNDIAVGRVLVGAAAQNDLAAVLVKPW